MRVLFFLALLAGFSLVAVPVAFFSPPKQQGSLCVLLAYDFSIIFVANLLALWADRVGDAVVGQRTLRASGLAVLAVLPSVLYQALKAFEEGGLVPGSLFYSVFSRFIAIDEISLALYCISLFLLSCGLAVLGRIRAASQGGMSAGWSVRIEQLFDKLCCPLIAVTTIVIYNLLNQSSGVRDGLAGTESDLYISTGVALSAILSWWLAASICFLINRYGQLTFAGFILILLSMLCVYALVLGLPGAEHSLFDWAQAWRSSPSLSNFMQLAFPALVLVAGVVLLITAVLLLIAVVLSFYLLISLVVRSLISGVSLRGAVIVPLVPVFVLGVWVGVICWKMQGEAHYSLYGESFTYRVQLGAYESVEDASRLWFLGQPENYDGCYVYQSGEYSNKVALSLVWISRIALSRVYKLFKHDDMPFVNFYPKGFGDLDRVLILQATDYGWPKKVRRAYSFRENCRS